MSRATVDWKGLSRHALLALSVCLFVDFSGCRGVAGPQGESGTDGTNGQDGTNGSPGPTGPQGVYSGILQGSVLNSLTEQPVEGVVVSFDPSFDVTTLTTDAQGGFQTELPVGPYTLTLTAPGYTTQAVAASLIAERTTRLDIRLVPEAPVYVNAGDDLEVEPGGSAPLAGLFSVLDGSNLISSSWTVTSGTGIAIDAPESLSATLTLPDLEAYKSSLISRTDQLDRVVVQAINPYILEQTTQTVLTLTVVTSSGTYSDSVTLTASLPWKVNTGLGNVPLGIPVLLSGADTESWSWILALPSGSKAVLSDAKTRHPYFTPDVAGRYTLSETVSGKSLYVQGASWMGAISGIGDDGYPLSSGCTGCHNDSTAPDVFTDWRETGHASIFSTQLNTSTHYGEDCFSCHGVGFDLDVDNLGMDDAPDYEDFLASGLLNHPSNDNWATVMAEFPATARMSNVQCENCHGPNNSGMHFDNVLGNDERVSLSSDLCASCHGEPARHGRFQQWQTTGHSNFELALEEATVEARGSTAGNCGRCHSAQGFVAWVEQGDLTKVIQGKSGNATTDELTQLGLTHDKVQPQSCAACHDPHMQGDTAYEPNTATVRLQDDVPMLPAGFDAVGVGRGAVCIACHNTRNGAHNDTVGDPASYSAPHTPSQSDLLMGQNAYFVKVGTRAGHSYLTDTCATCHMEEAAPPAEYSYYGSGTNHSFVADASSCSSCHGNFNGGTFQSVMEAEIAELRAQLEQTALTALNAEGLLSVRAFSEDTGLYSSASSSSSNVTLDVTSNPIVGVELLAFAGQQSFRLTLTSPVAVTFTDGTSEDLTTFGCQLGSLLDASNEKVYPLSSNYVRAFWNLLLVENDGSLGVHNPSFAQDILDATLLVDLSD